MHPHVTGYSPEELTVVVGPDIQSGERMAVLSGALPPDGSDVACCDDGACDPVEDSSGAGWGSAGCTVEPFGASRQTGGVGGALPFSSLVVAALAALSFAFRRRPASRRSRR